MKLRARVLPWPCRPCCRGARPKKTVEVLAADLAPAGEVQRPRHFTGNSCTAGSEPLVALVEICLVAFESLSRALPATTRTFQGWTSVPDGAWLASARISGRCAAWHWVGPERPTLRRESSASSTVSARAPAANGRAPRAGSVKVRSPDLEARTLKMHVLNGDTGWPPYPSPMSSPGLDRGSRRACPQPPRKRNASPTATGAAFQVKASLQ